MFFNSYKDLVAGTVVTGQKVDIVYEHKPTLKQVRGRIFRRQGSFKIVNSYMTCNANESLIRDVVPGMESEEAEREAIIKISVAKFTNLLATADPPLRKQLLISRLLTRVNASRNIEDTVISNMTDAQPLSIATEAVFSEF